MREKKYADVLKKYEEDIDEKMSMTREIKFKDLQESMDKEAKNEEVQKTTEESISKTSIKKLDKDEEVAKVLKVEEEIDKIRDEENKKRKELKIKEVNEEVPKSSNEEIDDDIYLTTSFKPLKTRISFIKIVKKIGIFMLFILVLGCVGYFAGVPMYKKYINSRPKIIFDKTIEYVSDKMINVINDFNIGNNSILTDIKFNVDNGSGELNEGNFGYRLGIASNRYENSLYMEIENSNYGINDYFNSGKSYTNFSTSDKYFLMEQNKIDKVYNKYSGYLNNIFEISSDDLRYVVLKERDIIKGLLLNEYIVSSKTEIDINNKSIEVVKNSYVIDKSNIKKIQKKYYEELIKDDKLIKIMSELSNLSVKEYKNELSNLVDSDIDDDYKLAFNIYTMDATKVVGLDIEENGFCLFYLYFYENYFDFYANLNDRDVVEFKGKKEDDIKATIKYNADKIIDLNIKNFDKERVEFSYFFETKKRDYSGEFVLREKEESVYDVEFSLRYDDYLYSFNSLFDLHYNDFKNVNEENIVKYSVKNYSNESLLFYEEIEEIGIKEGFLKWQEIFDDFINEISKK